MIALLVKHGVVVNSIVVDDVEELRRERGADYDLVIGSDLGPAGVGWTYDGKKFTKPIEPPIGDNRLTTTRLKAACELLISQWSDVGNIRALVAAVRTLE